MTPVKQSKLALPDGIHRGNCLAACLASLLDIPLWMVPPFEDMFGGGYWKERLDEWLLRFFGLQMIRVEGHPVERLPEYYMASGLSNRGILHGVIYRHGALAHDPHYSDEGIQSVEWCEYLQAVQSLKESV